MKEIVQGKRIFLRPMTGEDTPLIVRWRNNPRVRQNFIFRETFTNPMHENWIRQHVETGDVVQFIICEMPSEQQVTEDGKNAEEAVTKTSGRPVGSVYFRDIDRVKHEAEYGIFIGEDDATGKGYGNETAQLAVEYAFAELGLKRIILRVFDDNMPARKSYEHAGFTFVQSLPQVECSDGEKCDMMLYEYRHLSEREAPRSATTTD